MKQRRFCLFISVLLLVTGMACSRPSHPFSLEDPDISPSMKRYLELDCEKAEGKFFQAKVMKAYKNTFHVSESRGDFNRYTFSLAIAPLRNEPYTLRKIVVYPLDEELFAYIRKNGQASAYNEYIWDLRDRNFSAQTADGDYEAYGAGVSFDDRGDIARNEAGITESAFDERIRGLRVVIYYNLFAKDELVLTFDGEWDAAEMNSNSFGRLTTYEESMQEQEKNRTEVQ